MTSHRGPAVAPGRKPLVPAGRRLDDIVRRMTASVDGLEPGPARQFARQVAPRPQPLSHLHHHLEARPDALVSGSSEVPLVVLRLIAVLGEAGFEGVVAPSCTDCGRVKYLSLHVEGGRVCRRCGEHRGGKACGRCGARRPVRAYDEIGPICEQCWTHDPTNWEICAFCDKPSVPCVRLPDGRAIGRCCKRGPQCDRCAENHVADAVPGSEVVCRRCRSNPNGLCESCSAQGPLVSIFRPALCPACYRSRSEGTCSACGQHRLVSTCRAVNDAALCRHCWPRPKGTCANCGHYREIQRKWPLGPVCGSCYREIRRNTATCPSCGEHQPLVGTAASGARICAACSGLDVDYRCRSCGQPGHMIVRGICERCLVVAQATELLAGSGGAASPLFEPFLRALAVADSPPSMLAWLRPGRGPAALLALLGQSGEISHEVLDVLPQDQVLQHLRDLFIHVGVLPERVEFLERLGPWIATITSEEPSHIAKVVRIYAKWSVVRRARQRSSTRPYTNGTAQAARRQVRMAVVFMRWLDTESITLGAVSQTDIERWLTEVSPSAGIAAAEFLKWARRHQLVGNVSIPLRQSSLLSTPPIREDDRWRSLRRGLNDDSLPLEIRLVGALVLTYGLTVSRIVALRADQIDHRDDGTYVRLGAHDLVLAPAIAGLLKRHQLEATSFSVLYRSVSRGPQWLFPGRSAGRPANSSRIVQKLTAHDVPPIRRARGAALITLAGDLPVPVLADLLGISISSAGNWARHAQHDWTAYVAARASSRAQEEDPR